MRQAVKERLALMDVTEAKLQHVYDATSQEEGEQRLEELKEVCKRGFHALARELHPDVNGGDPEKTARFKQLKNVYESFQKATYKGWRKQKRSSFSRFGNRVGDYANDLLMQNFIRAKQQIRRQRRDAFVQAVIDELAKQKPVALAGHRGVWFPKLGKWMLHQKRRHEVSQ